MMNTRMAPFTIIEAGSLWTALPKKWNNYKGPFYCVYFLLFFPLAFWTALQEDPASYNFDFLKSRINAV